jgi:hypothetical protein
VVWRSKGESVRGYVRWGKGLGVRLMVPLLSSTMREVTCLAVSKEVLMKAWNSPVRRGSPRKL